MYHQLRLKLYSTLHQKRNNITKGLFYISILILMKIKNNMFLVLPHPINKQQLLLPK